MTRRSSLRAQTREIYRAMAAAKATAETPNVGTPTPNPSPQGGGEQKEGGGEQGAASAETSLTARVRALYEDSAVPVREIAGVAGVSERTIYKYAAKQRWKKRYARTPGFAPDFAQDLAPVRGAGARFIRREDKGKPVATGLKALDPAGGKRAAAGCREAAHLSRQALAEAERVQRADDRIHAMDLTRRVLCQLRVYLDARDKARPAGRPAPDNDLLERVLTLAVNVALNRWQALLAEGEGAAG